MDVIRKIRDCIRASSLTQKEISAKLGISEDSMVRYLKGTSQFKLDMLIRLSEILQISLIELLTDEVFTNLSVEEEELLEAYQRADAGTQKIVRKILDIPEGRSKSSESLNGKVG